MSAPTSTPTARVTDPRHRPPVTVLAAVGLTVLVTLVGGYGAIYFSGLDGFTELDLTFLVAYEFLTGLGLVSALAMARRSALGRAGLVTYGIWITLFNLFKIGYVHEAEAVPFGVVGLAVLALALTRSARDYTDA
jgi:hypothetical protein